MVSGTPRCRSSVSLRAKWMFVEHTSAYVVMPRFRHTRMNWTEAMTLIQTGKIRRIPVILMGSD